MSIAKRVIFKGLVQHVFFRDFVKTNADKLGVKGYVKNMPDGTVEAVFEEEEKIIDKLVEKCRKGPRGANVKNTVITIVPVKPYSDFQIEY